MTAARRAGRRPTVRGVEVTAHAKLNLGLAVGPLREDGFHDLVTLFQSVTLADTLRAERTRSGFALRVRHEEAAVRGRAARKARALVPPGADNLVIRAARLVSERLGLPGGARFTLTKRIPAQAGMGGGSADAAAAIAAVLALHGRRLSRPARLELAEELGSDVPFALTGGTALGTGRGELLRALQLGQPLRAIVAVPSWRISTREAFRRLDASRKGLTWWRHGLRFAASLGRKRVTATAALGLGNSFEAELGRHRSDFDALCARMREAGLVGPRLTGSGSGVFGIVPSDVSVREVVGRFTGPEPLYPVRSAARGLRVRVLS